MRTTDGSPPAPSDTLSSYLSMSTGCSARSRGPASETVRHWSVESPTARARPIGTARPRPYPSRGSHVNFMPGTQNTEPPPNTSLAISCSSNWKINKPSFSVELGRSTTIIPHVSHPTPRPYYDILLRVTQEKTVRPLLKKNRKCGLTKSVAVMLTVTRPRHNRADRTRIK